MEFFFGLQKYYERKFLGAFSMISNAEKVCGREQLNIFKVN